MYKENPQFEAPVNRKSKIWRYMTFEKYKAMLESHSLYFCTGEKLRSEDPYEGSCLGWELMSDVRLEVAQEFVQKMRSCGPPLAINCWHLNEFESMAMWRLYGDQVAVQSTFDRLVNSFGDCPCDVKIGRVKYLMPDSEHFDPKRAFTIFMPYLHKHRGFEYEQELRAIVRETGNMQREPDGGILAPVDLKMLMETVYVSPQSEPDLKVTIEKVTKSHGLETPIRKSKLAKLPFY